MFWHHCSISQRNCHPPCFLYLCLHWEIPFPIIIFQLPWSHLLLSFVWVMTDKHLFPGLLTVSQSHDDIQEEGRYKKVYFKLFFNIQGYFLITISTKILNYHNTLYKHTDRCTHTHVWLCVLDHVQLFVTPQAVACQALLFMGLSQQEYWSGLPFSPL